MLKKAIEAPFHAIGWLFHDTYGRVVAILLLTILVCFVNYPPQDVKVGVWEVEDTLKPEFSRENGPTDVDSVGRIDRTAIEKRRTIGRVRLDSRLAWLTLPFHNISEREVVADPKPRRTPQGTQVIKRRQVEVTSRGLTLGLDLRGGTRLTFRIAAPDDDKGGTLNAQEIAEIIRTRIDSQGLKEPRVQPMGTNRILVEVPGFDKSDVATVRRIIERTGRLEFRLVADEGSAVLADARGRDTPPDKWHWYDPPPDESGEDKGMPRERLLISDEIGLTGENIKHVSVGMDRTGTKIALHLSFKDKQAFWKLTRQNVGRRLAIIFDDVRDKDDNLVKTGHVQSAPVINEPIPGDAEISGNFTLKSANELRLVLQSGSLRWPLEFESEQYVGPHQGRESIEAGARAALVGFIIIIIFMAGYYFKAGLVADFALLLNVLILVAAMALRGTTLTLPGIAGIALTAGMAVDANVLIFERIREEMKKMTEKPLLKCIDDGHSKALITIVDANLTTIITAVILYLFGSGPVKGFAVTLSYGLIVSMFTAIVVTRAFLHALIKAGLMKELKMLEAVENPNISFIAMRRICMTASAIVVVGGLLYFFAGPGNRLGIEFSSGTKIEVNLRDKTPGGTRIDAELVRSRMRAIGYSEAEVQEVGTTPALAGRAGTVAFTIRLRSVPTVVVKTSGRISAPDDAQFDGGAQVVVHLEREVDPKEMERRLGELGPAVFSVTKGQPVGKLYVYTVRSSDKAAEAVSDLESSVRAVFGDEQVTGDIRQAFVEGGQSLLVDEGVRQTAESGGRITVRVALRDPATVDVVSDALKRTGVADFDVRAEGEMTDGKSSVLLISAPTGALPRIKDALKTSNLPTLEPFASVEKVSPFAAGELGVKAIIALLLSFFAIVAYIWFRFEFRFGLGAVIALVHDVAITLTALALTGREISLTVIAGILTVVGYSLNDTIVVFDRIRENRRTVRKMNMGEIVDLSINQTLSRTVLTSVTTLFAVLPLYFFGGPAIKDFAFVMLVGVVVGTYSSMFIASPILLMTGEQGALRGALSVAGTRVARPLEGVRGA